MCGAEERLFTVTHRLTRIALFAMVLATLTFASSSTLAQESAPATPEAVAPQLPATVTDVDGNQVTVTDVSRIVPLSGDVAEIVWTLGLGANIVGVDLSAVYPAELTQLPQIGFERQLSAEGILSLNPTLVIGKEQAGPPAVLDQVRAAGVPVVIVAEPQTIEAPTAKIRSVAAALGVAEAGEALATKTQAEIDEAMALAATATSKPTVMFLYVRSGGVQLIGGSGSVADAMIEAAGGVDAGVAAGIQGFMPVTAEAIVAAQPDYVIVPQSGLDSIGGMDALLQIPGLAETPAAKNGNVLAIDDLLLLSMTPRTGQALHALILAIHPELAAATPEASPVA
jgi:iron complex transport system substrate-binding protein